MRRACAIFAVCGLAASVWAQQSSKGQQSSPTAPVRIEMVCRDMGTTGNYLAPNETMIANKACHPVEVQHIDNSAAATTAHAAAIQPPPTSTAVPAAAPTPPDIYVTNTPVVSSSESSIRVYVTDNESWAARGGWTGQKSATPAAPETPKEAENTAAEVDKLITAVNDHCPQVLITSDITKAGFAVTLDREGKNRMSERNRVVVFDRGGDDIYSADMRGLGESLDAACKAIVSSANKK
jgi:hypothetical protein